MALLFEGGGLSHDNNKKKRVDGRMKVSDLKKICSRRDLVEKRKYLQEQPFQLRDFIAATWIDKIREGYIQKQEKRVRGLANERDEAWDAAITATERSNWYDTRRHSPVAHRYGYHPGGWGKPPVSEYGDVFGVQQQDNQEEELIVNTKHWGDLEEEDEEKEEELTEEEEQTGGEESEANIQSVGVETSDVIDLCKRPRTEPDKYLYQVLEKKEERIALGTLLGTPYIYVIGGSGTPEKTAGKGVDIC
ncbi:hypothetical protein RHSIM_Rhsim02G0211700 [Rhododendron simsii]|uniref:Uncharacterized protein n=1 Tax=Rhododendron simsii TaxID=118357 RepID=A0A834HCP8_RHOSS|nr:hypothetical protein RHSIM_Rhsim02G0211700 [Rhododendron simsii]